MIPRVRTYVRNSVRSAAPLYLLDRVSLGPDRGNAICVRMRTTQLAVIVAHECPSAGGELVDGEPLQGFMVGVAHDGDCKPRTST